MSDLPAIPVVDRNVDGGFTARYAALMSAAAQFGKSSIIPEDYRGKPADIFVALEYGSEIGLQPMASLQNIFVIDGKPSLSAQVMAALVKNRPDYLGMTIDSNEKRAKVTIRRKLASGSVETAIGEFTIEQADTAGLTGKKNWKSYPQQMLEARALAFAMRKAYPDILAGILTREEAEDISDIRSINDDPSTEATITAAKNEKDELRARMQMAMDDPAITAEEKKAYKAKIAEGGGLEAISIEAYKAIVEDAEEIIMKRCKLL